MAGGVHEAGRAVTGGAGSPVVDEVAGCYRLAGDLEPPSFPLLRGLRRLVGGEQVVPAERTVPVLPGAGREHCFIRALIVLPQAAGQIRNLGREIVCGCSPVMTGLRITTMWS